MASKSRAKRTLVPRGTENPIAYLLDHGWSMPQLAAAWGLKTDNTVYRLLRFKHIPRYRTAVEIAKTFGWSSPGEVLDFYAAKVRAAA